MIPQNLVSHTATLVVIDTDCIGRCKSNYHTITTMTTPTFNVIWLQVHAVHVHSCEIGKHILCNVRVI